MTCQQSRNFTKTTRLMNHHHLHRIQKDSVRAPLWLVNVRSIIERRVIFLSNSSRLFREEQNKTKMAPTDRLLNFERSATFWPPGGPGPRPTSQVSPSAFWPLVAYRSPWLHWPTKKGGAPNNPTRNEASADRIFLFLVCRSAAILAGRMHGRLNMFSTKLI